MIDSKVKDLKQAINDISDGNATQEKIDSLTKAFELFTQETARLEGDYATLNSQFKLTNEKLEEALVEINQLQTTATRNVRMKELGEMTSLLAHEIRNPLGGIKGFAALLQRDLKDNPQMQQMAGLIVKGADTLNKLVTNVLNYARPLKLNFEPTDIVSLIKDVKKNVEGDGGLNKNVAINFESDESLITVPLDQKLFRSALMNLIVNAIQAMPNGGSVNISLNKVPDAVQLVISDTGVGIAPENLNKIFSPFFTTKQEGNGFGLVEVNKVVQAHSGVIEVKSEINNGTVFKIKIPLPSR